MYDLHYRLAAERQARLRAEADARRIARAAQEARSRPDPDRLAHPPDMVGRRVADPQKAHRLGHGLAAEHAECQPSH